MNVCSVKFPIGTCLTSAALGLVGNKAPVAAEHLCLQRQGLTPVPQGRGSLPAEQRPCRGPRAGARLPFCREGSSAPSAATRLAGPAGRTTGHGRFQRHPRCILQNQAPERSHQVAWPNRGNQGEPSNMLQCSRTPPHTYCSPQTSVLSYPEPPELLAVAVEEQGGLCHGVTEARKLLALTPVRGRR